ncbi:hypothetical protein DYH10_02035 [Candidatus Saccharibacteria bacterium CPR2]|nr:hypothetical protein [Candidatus Saccharibacteria bacterium CPR2]
MQQGLTGTGAGPFTNVYNLSTISKTEAATIYGQQIRVNDTSSSIAHTIYGLYVDNSTGTTNASATINSIFANVDSANAGNLLQLQSDSANVFTVSNTGATTIQNGSLTVGDSDSAGTIVLSDGSSNTGTIQLAALGSNEVYIFPDSDGSDTVCLLDLNNCATGGTVTLQNAYGNGNNITTTEADGDIEFDLADTTTDQDFVVDIQGTGNTIQFQDGGTAFATFSDGGKALFKPTSDATDVFRIQNTAGTSTVFNVDTTNTRITVNGASGDLANRDLEVVDAQVTTRLRVGTGSNYVDFQANGGQIYYGTARPTQTVTLIPEFPGASLWGDGTYNSGTMTSDFCSNETGLSVNTSICGSGHEHNYYAWTATDSGQAQDYDIYVRYQLPKDFGGFSASDTIKLFGWVTSTTSNYDKVELSLYDDGGNQCGSTTTINSSNTIWENTAMTGDETACTGIDADDAGDTITFKIKVYARNGGYARVGELSFSYYAKF